MERVAFQLPTVDTLVKAYCIDIAQFRPRDGGRVARGGGETGALSGTWDVDDDTVHRWRYAITVSAIDVTKAVLRLKM